MIYLAPLQGFTDFVYRKAYSAVFTGVDAFFIPYIQVKNDVVPTKYFKEIVPENNKQHRVVPQVLAKDAAEIEVMGKLIVEQGYSELNLNLGCPYPMVTNRNKGAGLLPNPNQIKEILSHHFKHSTIELSVKFRAGLNSQKEIENVLPVLNSFPLKEIILHPRIAKQLYTGSIHDEAFAFASQNTKYPLAFNGDVFSVEDYKRRKHQFPTTNNWMLGRGILMNPFLPEELKGTIFSDDEKYEKLTLFHKYILEEYLEIMDNEGNALNKMQQFWFYFSYCFAEQKKTFKRIKKAKNMKKFLAEVYSIFANY